jgi:hypothetical protein
VIRPAARVGDRLRAALHAVTAAREPSPRTRRWLAALGGAAVLVAVVVSIRALEVRPADLRLGPLLLVLLVLTPLTIAANAAELRVMATATAPQRLSWADALQAVVVATAANLLPLPGAAVVRVQALRIRGASAGAATAINVAGAGVWLGTGLLVAGGALLVVGEPDRRWAAGIALLVGLAGSLVSLVVVGRAALPGRAVRSAVALVGVEAAVTVLHGVRLLVVLAALQVTLGVEQALVIALSAPLAAAAGVMPAGIGIAEALAGLLAPLVALPPAAGVAATGINRILGLAVTVPLAAGLAARRARR